MFPEAAINTAGRGFLEALRGKGGRMSDIHDKGLAIADYRSMLNAVSD